MASLNESGLEALVLSLEELAELPDSVAAEMLAAEGRVVASAHRRKLAELKLVDSGQLLSAVATDGKVRKKGDTRSITVYPRGARRKRGQEKKPGTNNEVGFINEYGASRKGIPAKQWMRTANEGCADEAVSAAAQVYERWLRSKGM